jgi:hypothetical protein
VKRNNLLARFRREHPDRPPVFEDFPATMAFLDRLEENRLVPDARLMKRMREYFAKELASIERTKLDFLKRALCLQARAEQIRRAILGSLAEAEQDARVGLLRSLAETEQVEAEIDEALRDILSNLHRFWERGWLAPRA